MKKFVLIPPKEKEQILSYWKEGKSYGEIATLTGRPRNSIAGFIFRHKTNNDPNRPYTIKKVNRSKKPRTRVMIERDYSKLVDLFDLKEGMCRYPVDYENKRLYCGRPVMFGSWCEECAKIVFRSSSQPDD